MKNIFYFCMLIILLHTISAEIRCKDSETHEEYILNPTDNENQLESFVGEINEKLKYLAEHTDKQCNGINSNIPANCYEALKNTHYTGIHEILVPAISSKPFEVFCDDDTYYGGWTVIARRTDGSTDFYKNWIDYKNGFGNLKGEFFIGLDTLHSMTSGDEKHELLFKLKNYYGLTKYAKYSEFKIGNEMENYVLKTLGTYTGDAEDNLLPHVGQKFTTKDKDNDSDNKCNCAVKLEGAWWFKDCYKSHVFGKDFFDTHWSALDPPHNSRHPHHQHHMWWSHHRRIQSVEILIRPIYPSTCFSIHIPI